jgi:hypothetical protein
MKKICQIIDFRKQTECSKNISILRDEFGFFIGLHMTMGNHTSFPQMLLFGANKLVNCQSLGKAYVSCNRFMEYSSTLQRQQETQQSNRFWKLDNFFLIYKKKSLKHR